MANSRLGYEGISHAGLCGWRCAMRCLTGRSCPIMAGQLPNVYAWRREGIGDPLRCCEAAAPTPANFNHILRLRDAVYALHAEVCHANNLAEHRRYPEPI
jgi:hypothetical protein